jgi:hypothetical protein
LGKYWLFFASVDNPATANSSRTTVAHRRLALSKRLFFNWLTPTVNTFQLWLSGVANARIATPVVSRARHLVRRQRRRRRCWSARDRQHGIHLGPLLLAVEHACRLREAGNRRYLLAFPSTAIVSRCFRFCHARLPLRLARTASRTHPLPRASIAMLQSERPMKDVPLHQQDIIFLRVS